MTRNELEKLVKSEREKIDTRDRALVIKLINEAEAAITEKIKANPNNRTWRAYVERSSLGHHTFRVAFDIIKKFKAEFTELEIVFEHPPANRPDQLYFQFKMES